MTKGNFGERLKREREMRGVSRDEICAATRIGTRFLEALENEQWEILPGGIFNRGFIRAVARFLGLDEDDLVAEYDLAISKPPSVAPAPGSAPPRRTRRVRAVSLTALSVLVLLGGSWLGWRWQHSPHKAVNEPNSIAATLTLPDPQSGQPQPNPPAPSGDSTGTAGPLPGTSPSQPGNERPQLELKIEAGKETRVSISIDGAKAFDGSMIAGQSRTFTAREDIDISANDAGALLLELNGQTLAPLGPPGQPGNATLTRSDLRPAGGGAN